MRHGLSHRPETAHASPLADCTTPLVQASVATTTQRNAMPIVPDAARNQGVLQIARAFLHLEDTITLRCLYVTASSLIDGYHIWNGRIRNIPSGSAIAADAIIPNRRWQHSDETDCPSRNWCTHVLMAFIRSRDSLTSMEVESRTMPRKCVICFGHRTLFSLFITKPSRCRCATTRWPSCTAAALER